MARVLLMTQPTDGGVFQHVSQLCEGLAANGHEPVLAGPFPAPPAGVPAEVVTLEMVRAVVPGADVRAVAATARLVRRVRPDLVHAHSSKAGAVARLLAPPSRAPRFCTRRTAMPLRAGSRARPSARAIDSWSERSPRSPRWWCACARRSGAWPRPSVRPLNCGRAQDPVARGAADRGRHGSARRLQGTARTISSVTTSAGTPAGGAGKGRPAQGSCPFAARALAEL